MALAVALWPIGDFAHLILGAALALSLSLLAVHILRSLAIPRLAVLPIALLLFVMVLSGSRAVGVKLVGGEEIAAARVIANVDRQSVVEGKGGSVRVDIGGRRHIKTKK